MTATRTRRRRRCSGVRALKLDDKVPGELTSALRALARATEALADSVGETERDSGLGTQVLQAVYDATTLLPAEHNLSLSVLVAYTQATAADLLRALGIDYEPAHEKVGHAAQAALG
jgi:hypothetical protein